MVLNAFQRARAELPWLHPRHGMVHCQILSGGTAPPHGGAGCHRLCPAGVHQRRHAHRPRTTGRKPSGPLLRLGRHGAAGPPHGFRAPTARWSAFTPWRGSTAPSPGGTSPETAPSCPEQALTPYQALYAYTAGGAYASGEERIKGRIRSGLLADFLLVDRNLLTCPPEELLSARVLRTYVGGACVFRDPSF